MFSDKGQDGNYFSMAVFVRHRTSHTGNPWLLRGLLSGVVFLCLGLWLLFARDNDLLGQQQQVEVYEKLPAAVEYIGRKNIYDRNFRELAVSFRLTSIYVRPLAIKDPAKTADKLADVLNLDPSKLLVSFKTERTFVWLGDEIGPTRAAVVAELNLPGVHLVSEVHRYYPAGEAAAHVIGFIKDEQGLAGVESYYNHLLTGSGVSDLMINSDDMSKTAKLSARDSGVHLVLTLDLRIQSLLELKLAALMAASSASSAMAVIINPQNGDILALVSLPSYNPNYFWRYTTSERRNRVLADSIVPGAINRLFRLAVNYKAAQVGGDLLKTAMISQMPQDYEQPTARKAAAEHDEPPDWMQIAENVYGTIALSMMGDQVVSEEHAGLFIEKTGFAAGSDIDLPLESSTTGTLTYHLDSYSSTTSLITLVTAFSRLLSRNYSLTPRILTALWDGGNKEYEVMISRDDRGRHDQQNVSSVGLLNMLAEVGSIKQDEMLFFESLTVQNSDALIVKQEGESMIVEEMPQLFDAVLLGVNSAETPDIVIALALAGAKLDVTAVSPLRLVADRIIGQTAQVLDAEQPRLIPRLSELREEENYLKWREFQNQSNHNDFLLPVTQVKKMPNVRGKSLRHAFQLLQQYDLPITVNGSGRVTAQYPAAGAVLTDSDSVVLKLRKR